MAHRRHASGNALCRRGADGQWVLPSNHSLFYTAAGASVGAELFALANDRPVAVNDSLGSVQAGSTISANVLTNDADADGALDASSVQIVTQPSGGSVTVAAGGSIIYTARVGFTVQTRSRTALADDQAYASSPATAQVIVTAPPAPPAPPSGGGGGGGGGGAMSLAQLLSLLLLSLWTRRAWGRR